MSKQKTDLKVFQEWVQELTEFVLEQRKNQNEQELKVDTEQMINLLKM